MVLSLLGAWLAFRFVKDRRRLAHAVEFLAASAGMQTTGTGDGVTVTCSRWESMPDMPFYEIEKIALGYHQHHCIRNSMLDQKQRPFRSAILLAERTEVDLGHSSSRMAKPDNGATVRVAREAP